MIKLPDGFFDLVVECKKSDISTPVAREEIDDEDIWDSAIFAVILRLGGILNEAQVNYLIDVLEEDSLLLDKKFISTSSYTTWSNRLLNVIENQRKVENNNTKLETLGIIKPSNNPEAPIRRLHSDLFSILEFIKNKPLNKKFINNLNPEKDKDLVAEMKMNVDGMGFTKATLFCYRLGLAKDYSAVSGHVKDFVDEFIKSDIDSEDYYVINHCLREEVLKNFQAKDSKILMRHIDLAIYTLYVGRAQLFSKRKKERITPHIILDWIEFKKIDLDKFLNIISDLDTIEEYSEEFTDFAMARI